MTGRKRSHFTVSVGNEYKAPLAELCALHKRSQTEIVEILIDRATANPAMLNMVPAPRADGGPHDGTPGDCNRDDSPGAP